MSGYPYDLEEEEFDHLRGVWLSRRMFGFMVGMREERSFEDWLDAVMDARAGKGNT